MVCLATDFHDNRNVIQKVEQFLPKKRAKNGRLANLILAKELRCLVLGKYLLVTPGVVLHHGIS